MKRKRSSQLFFVLILCILYSSDKRKRFSSWGLYFFFTHTHTHTHTHTSTTTDTHTYTYTHTHTHIPTCSRTCSHSNIHTQSLSFFLSSLRCPPKNIRAKIWRRRGMLFSPDWESVSQTMGGGTT